MMIRTAYLYVLCVLSITNICYSQQDIISEEILIENGNFKLPGTLTYTSNVSEQPLVIFIHGSGDVDRNGNQASAGANPNYLKQLNDSLVAKGIAFYRYDKRTATRENLMEFIKNMYFEAFVEDANLVIDKFKNDQRFSSITLIGHSQGSLISMLVDHTHIDKFISLAGPGNTLEYSLVNQVRSQNGDSLANIVQSHFKELSEKGSIKNVDKNLMVLFNKPTQPFVLSWTKYIPSDEIKKLQMPILILNGDKDVQVTIEDAEALHNANPKSKMVIIKNMNHVLKIIEKESDIMLSKMTPDFPLSQELVSIIETFIKH